MCVWQELQSVRTEISCLEEQKKTISDTVRALVVGVDCSFKQLLRDVA